MAKKRMFSMDVIDTDRFMEMPSSAQNLYFHLGMHGDDDGFIASPKRIMRAIGSAEDDLKLLITKGFIIPFESGVVVITDWRANNNLRNDRYHETRCLAEKKLLSVDETTGKYALLVSPLATYGCAIGIPSDNQSDTNGLPSIAKHSITEQSITDSEYISVKPQRAKRVASTKHKFGEYKNVLLTDEEFEKLKVEFADYTERIERLSAYVASTGKSYKSHYATIRNWARKETPTVAHRQRDGFIYDYSDTEGSL